MNLSERIKNLDFTPVETIEETIVNAGYKVDLDIGREFLDLLGLGNEG